MVPASDPDASAPTDPIDPVADAPLISELPDAIDDFETLWAALGGRDPAVFVDYDGTLTGLVDDPADATIDPRTRTVLTDLAEHVPVAVVSGRDLADVRGMVGIDTLSYAGSHGFDLRLADGTREQYGTEFLADLDHVEQQLRELLEPLPGARVERKGFAVAVHTRLVTDAEVERRVEDIVGAQASEHARLALTGGKKVVEFRPDIEWDKGRALGRLMDVLSLDRSRHAPLYLGDDLTDEDGFAAISGDGVGVVVTGDEDRPTVARFRLADPDAARRFLELLASRAHDE